MQFCHLLDALEFNYIFTPVSIGFGGISRYGRGVVSTKNTLIDAFSHIKIDQSTQHLAAIPSVTGLLLAQRSLTSPLLVVCSSSRRASEIIDELDTYLGIGSAVEFDPWETLPHEKLSPKSDTVAKRVKMLSNLSAHKIIITSVRALIQQSIKQLHRSNCRHFQKIRRSLCKHSSKISSSLDITELT